MAIVACSAALVLVYYLNKDTIHQTLSSLSACWRKARSKQGK